MTRRRRRLNEAVRKTQAIVYRSGGEWTVYIPPVLPEDWESGELDDNEAALIGPAGDSSWSTFDEAVVFLIDVLSDAARVEAMAIRRARAA